MTTAYARPDYPPSSSSHTPAPSRAASSPAALHVTTLQAVDAFTGPRGRNLAPSVPPTSAITTSCSTDIQFSARLEIASTVYAASGRTRTATATRTPKTATRPEVGNGRDALVSSTRGSYARRFPARSIRAMRRYTSADEDSGRWRGFRFRRGDIVVSTRSKHGTTWAQAILLTLIHGAKLPQPLAELAPWLDHLVEPRQAVVDRLDRQPHRRVIKTHTPLDGLPIDPRARYVVVARHPLDAAVSLYHQGDNLDLQRLQELTGNRLAGPTARPAAEQWLRSWIEQPADPLVALDSLDGVLWHLTDAWSRRGDPNVVLVHYDDLLADLVSQVRRLAGLLDLELPGTAEDIAAGLTLERMRTRSDRLAPDPQGVLRDTKAFFRRGTSGAGAELLDDRMLAAYYRRAEALAPPDLLAWLHR